jgi:hypothetical protein
MNGSACRAWLVLPFCAVLCGCGMTSEPLEKTIEQTYRIDPDARISITNRDGSIEVYGWGKPDLYVGATEKAYTTARLNGLVVNVAAKPGSVSITTTFPPDKTWSLGDRSGTVDYVIVVPATAKISRLELRNGEVMVTGMEGGEVHAILGSGRLFARNCFSDLHLQAGTGALALIYDWWEPRKFSAEATIKNGKTSVTMPGDASFHILAETPNGRITNDFAHQEERHEPASQKTDMVAGETPPNAEIKVRAQNGNVAIIETKS